MFNWEIAKVNKIKVLKKSTLIFFTVNFIFPEKREISSGVQNRASVVEDKDKGKIHGMEITMVHRGKTVGTVAE